MLGCTVRNEKESTPRRSSQATAQPSTGVSLARDLHSNDRVPSDTSGAAETETPNNNVLIVDWDGPDDPSNPKKCALFICDVLIWSFKQKLGATVIVSAFAFISPVSSSMMAPASEQIAEDFAITNKAIIAMTTSIFLLAYALGPLVLGPLSELYGRSRVLQIANIWYLAWNLGCGFAQNTGQFIAFRFLAGLGGSAAISIPGGVISDTWDPEERGMAMGLVSLAPLLGPVLGPMTGAWIAEKSRWQWVFWSTSILDGFIQILGFVYLRETYPPVLLERKAKLIRRTLNDQEKGCQPREVKTIYTNADRHWKIIFKKALTRPFIFFSQELIIQVGALYMMFTFGLIYIFFTTLPAIFGGVYQQRPGIAGLNYIALGIGLTGASQTSAVVMDKAYAKLKQKYGKEKPEFRLLALYPSGLLIPAGLLITGWAVESKSHWIVADVGLVLIGSGVILVSQGIQTYAIDSYSLHSASALAAVSILRSIAGFGFPLFAPEMFKSLGYGVGSTVLAVAAFVIGVPSPILFWKFGERIRNASVYAVKTSQ